MVAHHDHEKEDHDDVPKPASPAAVSSALLGESSPQTPPAENEPAATTKTRNNHPTVRVPPNTENNHPHLRVDFHASKLMATAAACTVAGLIAYPAEKFRHSFTYSALSAWDFERNAMSMSKDVKASVQVSPTGIGIGTSTTPLVLKDQFALQISNAFQQNRKRLMGRIVVSPLVRLVSHEIACVGTYNAFEKFSIHSHGHEHEYEHDHSASTMKEVAAGAISGFCQALILCPLELHRANQVKLVEERERTGGRGTWRYWANWTKSQLWQGGTGDPQERWRRAAYHGVGTLAAREMVFNISFYPMFYGLWRYFDANDTRMRWALPANVNDHDRDPSKNYTSMVISGIISGLICSLAVTPMDVFKTYMMYSREKWSIWSGTEVIGPCVKVLFRTMTAQAFVLGPTFGIIAAVYELA